ncbi:hypothetical protein BCV70DRAFT_224840 [Testicularia cyperi]|uniref:Uncharacterized protein n=1 Tax=Testicularia cyperi TaxID=1882483 RepID=A0A317XZ31_9BASI|nr:hypothetical protein BCV70DRAFT_224840 [Testicularia cyperi]
MQRHDGNEYLHAVFAGVRPTMDQSIALMRMMQEGTTWNLGAIGAQFLLMAEILRTIPAEVRLLTRLIRRRKPNMAECLFVAIKYFALIAVVLDVILSATFVANSQDDCHNWAWTSSTMYFLCSWLVFCAIVWRATIIFSTYKWIAYTCYLGLAGQLAMALWTNYRVVKPDDYSPAGVCVPHQMMDNTPAGGGESGFWDSATFWFLLYNTIFDLCVLTACCIRLLRTARGPGGLTKIARVLFVNNVHYMLGVEMCNLIEIILLMGWWRNMPQLHQPSIAIQIIMGLNMIVQEQEAVYSPTYSKQYGFSEVRPGSSGGPTHSMASSNTRVGTFSKRPGTAGSNFTAPSTAYYRGRADTTNSFRSLPYRPHETVDDNSPPPPQPNQELKNVF